LIVWRVPGFDAQGLSVRLQVLRNEVGEDPVAKFVGVAVDLEIQFLATRGMFAKPIERIEDDDSLLLDQGIPQWAD
jgi:hypothetical protein